MVKIDVFEGDKNQFVSPNRQVEKEEELLLFFFHSAPMDVLVYF